MKKDGAEEKGTAETDICASERNGARQRQEYPGKSNRNQPFFGVKRLFRRFYQRKRKPDSRQSAYRNYVGVPGIGFPINETYYQR